MDRTMLVLLNHIINALLIFCVKSVVFVRNMPSYYFPPSGGFVQIVRYLGFLFSNTICPIWVIVWI